MCIRDSLKDKLPVFTKPPRGISTWAPFPGLTDKTRDMARAASSRLIARKELDAENVQLSKAGDKKNGFWKSSGKKVSEKAGL
eukprot:8586546-Pyramimonas_sp.AAC.1